MRKLAFCICETKGADQLCSCCCTADQCLCFYVRDNTTPLLLKSGILVFSVSSVNAQVSLCWTWSETLKTSLGMTGSNNVASLLQRLAKKCFPSDGREATVLFKF